MKSIKLKMVIIIGVIILIICIGLGYSSFKTASFALISKVEETLPQLAEQGANVVAERLKAQLECLEIIASMEQIENTGATWDAKKQILLKEVERNGYIRIGIADINGDMKGTDGSNINIKDMEYFKKTIAGQKNVTSPFESKLDNSLIIAYAVPISSGNQVIGAIIAVKDGNALSELTNPITFGKSGKAFMIDELDFNIAHNDAQLVMKRNNTFENLKKDPTLKSLAELHKKMIAGEKGSGEYTYKGEVKYLGFAPVKGTGWSIAVAAPLNEVLAGLTSLKNTMIYISVIFVLIGIGAGFWISSSFANPMIQISEHLKVISTGDFSKIISPKLTKYKHEIGVLARSLNTMQTSVKDVIRGVMQESSSVDEAVDAAGNSMVEINGEIEDVSATTEELSASMQETAASMEEMNATSLEIEKAIDSIASKAQEGAASANEINKRATQLRENFLSSQQSAQKIFMGVKSKLETALEESKAVEQINTLADVILQITSQTNLLALNAAIEAARAGEAGKGFAVVADEIRKLAENSKSTVTQIQSITKQVVCSVDNLSTSSNSLLSFMATDVDKDYKTMLNATEEYNIDAEMIDNLVTDFSATSEELAASVENMIRSINEITAATNEGAEGTNNIAKKAENVAQKASDIMQQVGTSKDCSDRLMKMVEKFKV